MKKTTPRPALPPAENPLCGRIIGAAFETIMKKGYNDTSMLEIATRAKVSKRDLYANFPNKQAVLVACIANRAARMQLLPNLPAPANRQMFASTLTAFGATVIREVCQPPVTAMYRLAVSEAERAPEMAAALDASRSLSRKALAELLVRARSSGILAGHDPQEMTERFFALLWGDLLLNRLLGAASMPKPSEIDRRARQAAVDFLELYASGTSGERGG
jgi:AcrR family transcriptional regulator